MIGRRLLKGAVLLAADAVEHGASAIESVHLQTAARTFDVLARVPGVAAPAAAVRLVYEGAVRSSYGGVRLGARATAAVTRALVDETDPEQQSG